MKNRVHYFSGILLTMFIGLHLLNHLFSLSGADAHIAFMQSLRVVYRNVFIETILLTAVVLQIITGVQQVRSLRKRDSQFWEKLPIWSGLYLAFFLLIHVSAVLTGRFLLHLDTNFYFGAAGLNAFPLNFFFVPYYSFAIVAFFAHIAAIHRQKMKRSVLSISPETQSKLILGAGFLMAWVLMYGLTNGFQGIEIPETYHILQGK